MNTTPTRIAVANQKGGVGKTTLAVCLAAEMTERGHDVSLVDADPQRSACAWAELGQLTYPVYEIPLDRRSEPEWAALVASINAECIIVDAAPNEDAVRHIIAHADIIIIPCSPSGLDLAATRSTVLMINDERQRRGADLGVVLAPNRVDTRTLEGRYFLDELNSIGEWVTNPIGYRNAFIRAFTSGEAVNTSAPTSKADQEIKTLCSLLELYSKSLKTTSAAR